MKFPEERKLFTVKDVSRACGVSRASLIRMEKSGFLKPYREPISTFALCSIGEQLLLRHHLRQVQ